MNLFDTGQRGNRGANPTSPYNSNGVYSVCFNLASTDSASYQVTAVKGQASQTDCRSGPTNDINTLLTIEAVRDPQVIEATILRGSAHSSLNGDSGISD